jgi:hypothetical protein
MASWEPTNFRVVEENIVLWANLMAENLEETIILARACVKFTTCMAVEMTPLKFVCSVLETSAYRCRMQWVTAVWKDSTLTWPANSDLSPKHCFHPVSAIFSILKTSVRLVVVENGLQKGNPSLMEPLSTKLSHISSFKQLHGDWQKADFQSPITFWWISEDMYWIHVWIAPFDSGFSSHSFWCLLLRGRKNIFHCLVSLSR